MDLFHFSTAFAMIALWAGSYHIRPYVSATHMPRYYVIYCHTAVAFSAILTGIMVTTKNFPARQLDVRPRPSDLHLQPDDRWTRNQLSYSFYVTTSVYDHAGFARHEQSNRASSRTNIDRFEICV
jgi:hypothetical protein